MGSYGRPGVDIVVENVMKTRASYLFSFDIISVEMAPLDELRSGNPDAFDSVLVRSNISFQKCVFFQQVLHTSQVLETGNTEQNARLALKVQ